MKHYRDPETKQVFAFEEDGSQDDLILDHYVEIVDDDDLEASRQAYFDEDFNARPYDKKRAYEYPPIGDQLDMIYRAGLGGDEFQAAILAVKNKYPKPE